ncbi:hypothetical protein [Ruminococcus sp.]|uniref:hypothetical protein n=1 Tax=Ruminococcus sp. TaxID=41978 RepID=UPI002614FF2D|nr:hypothetical protein [Ruminococcus sp.]MDD6990167.1 hypothetical protein [Ruminococcus sp.]MDY6202877.1 Rho termination protein [Ruminococcus sp.]
MYKVIKYFTDMQDNDFAYNVGDEYPRKGMSVLPSRIKELATDKNRQGVPLIEEIPDIQESPEKKTKSTKKADKE